MSANVTVGYTPEWRDGKPVLPRRIEFDGHPLAVIDPEDREQVERLIMSAWPYAYEQKGMSDNLQTALRELANPPTQKPDEPTGLGAVVEAADGRWVRIAIGRYGWVRGDNMLQFDERFDGTLWNDIAAVKVLSDGWKP
jgi:hypothetical protein